MGIRLEHVSYLYEQGTAMQVRALDDVSLSIDEGEFIGLIGHTGSGKSTLIQLMNGLETPAEGRVFFDGTDVESEDFSKRDLRFQVGLVFQYPEHQLFEATVLEDVMFGPRNQGLGDDEARERAKQALSQTGISEDIYDSSPFDLSGGQKRRVAIAGVLAMSPRYLILDEPCAGLDPKGRDEILDLLTKMHEQLGMTIILVSHSMEDVARYVQRIIVMDHGQKKLDGTPKEVFAHYEELEKMGLSAPAVFYILKKLNERGIRVDPTVLTVEEAADEIEDFFHGPARGSMFRTQKGGMEEAVIFDHGQLLVNSEIFTHKNNIEGDLSQKNPGTNRTGPEFMRDRHEVKQAGISLDQGARTWKQADPDTKQNGCNNKTEDTGSEGETGNA